MTVSVIAIPNAPKAPAQVSSANAAAPAEATDTPVKGPFQSALMKQLQGQIKPGSDKPSAAPDVLAALTQALAGDGKPTSETEGTDGTALPETGQLLPLDPSLLASEPPKALPAGGELAAAVLMSVDVAVADKKPVAPRLHLTPIANAVAQVATALGESARAAPAVPAMPAVFAALAPQKDNVTVAQTVAVSTELPVQTATLPGSSALPPALVNMLASSATPTTAPPATAVALPVITVPVAQPGWDQALGQRVQWLVSQQMQGAELRITPPNLGPIEVRISIGHDQQTVVNFASPHAAVRDAIEAAMPRLRDMLSNNGQDLVNVNVSQHSFAEQRRQAGSSEHGHDSAGYQGDLVDEVLERGADTVVPGRSGLGLVDYFA